MVDAYAAFWSEKSMNDLILLYFSLVEGFFTVPLLVTTSCICGTSLVVRNKTSLLSLHLPTITFVLLCNAVISPLFNLADTTGVGLNFRLDRRVPIK